MTTTGTEQKLMNGWLKPKQSSTTLKHQTCMSGN